MSQPHVVRVERPRTNGLAVASFVLGLLWLLWLGSLLAIIFGHMAIEQIERSDRPELGRGLAVAGLWLGYGAATLLAILVAARLNGGP